MYQDEYNKSQSGLGIAALIMSFTGCLTLVGLICAVVDLARGDESKKHTCAKIALGFSIFYLVVGLLSAVVFLAVFPKAVESGNVHYTLNGEEVSQEEFFGGLTGSSGTEIEQNDTEHDSIYGTESNNGQDSIYDSESTGEQDSIYDSNDTQNDVFTSSGAYDSIYDSGSQPEELDSQSSTDSIYNSDGYSSNSTNSMSNIDSDKPFKLNGTNDANTVEYWIDVYLDYGYSRSEIIRLTVDSANSNESAVEQALNNYNIDWNEYSLYCANEIIKYGSGFSKEQLEYSMNNEGFTPEEVNYTMSHIQVDWNNEAVKCLQSYLDADITFDSKEEAISQLEFEGFTAEQAEYAASKYSY